jgi:hypothetical protein
LPVYPAGQLRTSAAQLARYLISFLNGGSLGDNRVLDSETVSVMTTVQYPTTTVLPDVKWGLGWYRAHTGSEWLWMHEGGYLGVRTGVYISPEGDFGFLLLTNRDDNYGIALILANMLEFARNVELPTLVQLRSFTAERQDDDVILNWEVASSSNHKGFHVWRAELPAEARRLTNTLLSGEDAYTLIDGNAPAGQVVYWLHEVEQDGNTLVLGSTTVSPRPATAKLPGSRCFPNPFNPSITISFAMPARARVTVTVYDATGREITVLVDDVMPSGTHQCRWNGLDGNGREAASGTYFYEVRTGKTATTGKMTLVK